jgi:RNA polymerase sigma-70 factor (ECF subfamily)
MLNYEAYEDSHLIELAQRGDQASFNALYDRYFSTVYNRVRYTIPDADVDDVTQEIFIAVMRSLHGFQGRSKFSTWLRTLVNRQVAGYYRSRERKVDETPILDGQQFSQSGYAGDQKHTERITIRRALQHLPPHYQEILLLRFAEGLKFREIAIATKQNPEAVKSLFRRAVATLRSQLDDGYDA